MKTKNWLWLLIAVFGWSFYACSDSENDKMNSGIVNVENVTHSLCKKETSRALYGETATYKVKGGKLHVELYDFRINCASKGADVKVKLNEETNEIILTPYDLGPQMANCTCPIDVSATITGLKYGKTYQCTIERMGISFSFICRNGVKGTVEP